jgi:nicotinamide riboside kinase
MAHLARAAGMKIALLGAESTGKTQLADELALHFTSQGKAAIAVPEVLREWCGREGREPRPEEQMAIAQEQERRVDAAAQAAQAVIADTTALMVAIYSGMLFEDGALLRFALERQRGYDVTLVTGLDLPWVGDGLQRQGPEVREQVDALVRDALGKGGVEFRVVYGRGEERLASALAAIDALSRAGSTPASAPPEIKRWLWACEKCGDPECEHRLFSALGARGATRS